MTWGFLGKAGFGWVFYIVVGLLVLGPIVLHPFTMTLGGPGDPQQFIWYLGWFWHAIQLGTNPFYTAFLNAPTGQNLMWNTSILAESSLFGPLAGLFSVTFTYNLLWLANFAISCVLGRHILGRLGVRNRLATAGGLLIGMLPYSTSQSLFHLHLWMTSVILAMTYLFMAGVQSEDHRPIRHGLGLGLLAAVQFYTSIEVFATMFLAAGLLLGLGFLVAGRRIWSYVRQAHFRFLWVAGIILAVLLLPGIYEMFHGPHRPHGPLLPSGVYVTDVLNLVVPTLVYTLHTPQTNIISSHYTGNFWENCGYIGIPGILLFLFASRRLWRHAAARVAALGSVVIILLSMGPALHVDGHVTHIWLPWSLFQKLPFINSALPSRLMLYAEVLMVLLIMCAIEDVLREPQRDGRMRHVVLTGMSLVLITWMPRIPYPRTETPRAAAALDGPSPILKAVSGQATYVLTPFLPETMQAIAQAGYPFPLVNPYGYTDNAGQRAHAFASLNNLLQENASRDGVRDTVRWALPALDATRVMYFPIEAGDHLTLAEFEGLTSAFGAPVAEDHGAIVWAVPGRKP